MSDISIEIDNYGGAVLRCESCETDFYTLDSGESIDDLVKEAAGHECVRCSVDECEQTAVYWLEEWRRETEAGTFRGWRFAQCTSHKDYSTPETWATVEGLEWELIEWKLTEVKTGKVIKSS